MSGYPENHILHDPEAESEGRAMVGLMFPVIYDWEESEVVRRYALAVGLEAGEPVEVFVSITNFADHVPALDAVSIGPKQADLPDEEYDEGLSVSFSDRPDIDFTELRRCVIADVLEGLPREGVDVSGIVSALDLEGGEDGRA